MAFINPRDAVEYLLSTGDRSVLTKTDPSRREELNKELRLARTKLQMRLESQPSHNEYQRLLKSHQSRSSAPKAPPGQISLEKYGIRGFTDAWRQGDSIMTHCGIKVKYVPLKNDRE